MRANFWDRTLAGFQGLFALIPGQDTPIAADPNRDIEAVRIKDHEVLQAVLIEVREVDHPRGGDLLPLRALSEAPAALTQEDLDRLAPTRRDEVEVPIGVEVRGGSREEPLEAEGLKAKGERELLLHPALGLKPSVHQGHV